MRDAVETFYYLFIFRFSQETYFQGNSSKFGRVYRDEKSIRGCPVVFRHQERRVVVVNEKILRSPEVGIYDGVLYNGMLT